MAAECPDLAEVLHQDFWFSRQQEQAPGWTVLSDPVFDVADGLLFSKWNRNRVTMAQRLEGVPPLTAMQQQATDRLDEVLRRPSLTYAMCLRQRPDPEQPCDAALADRIRGSRGPGPEAHIVPAVAGTAGLGRAAGQLETVLSVRVAWAVRGGITGQAYDETRRAYERQGRRRSGDAVGPGHCEARGARSNLPPDRSATAGHAGDCFVASLR